ncbi:MAG: DEAD/DEAH box helicase, partial [Bdellovibrionaceae bacterium]|nr:DEAD/DEAH box helicase [Pseudobdellovibrionaceae bacterium]
MLTKLPIDDFIFAIREPLLRGQNLVLIAEPGAGKTTRVPAALCKDFQRILVLEPRRMAAVSAADRIATENGWELGKEVGYQVRFENLTSKETRIVFMTEALLIRRMLRDPELQGVDLVILDEFHERSLFVDLALGALRELQQMGSPLRILVMSATLNTSRISEFLGKAPVVQVPGQLHPLEIQYSKEPQMLNTGADFVSRVADAIKTVFTQRKGDLLAFLPGRGEIQRVQPVS